MIEFNERLHQVELQLARIVSHIESERGSIGRYHEAIEKMISELKDIVVRHDKIILGTLDKPGILTKLDRLEQAEDARKWGFRVIWGAILTIMTKIGFDLLKAK